MSISDELLNKYGIERSDPILPVLELQKDLQEENTNRILSIFDSFDDKKVEDSVNLLGRIGMKLDSYSEELKSSSLKNITLVISGVVFTMLINWGLHTVLKSSPDSDKLTIRTTSEGTVYSVNIEKSKKVEVDNDVVKVTF